ncbi:hypothetical protein [Alkalihalobacterium alkalinitrilicum]|nr:hypothetical protein [Alkalihalobacterium alkalinitrilicum]
MPQLGESVTKGIVVRWYITTNATGVEPPVENDSQVIDIRTNTGSI